VTVPDRKIVESILFLADEPVPVRQIGEVLEKPVSEMERLLGALRDEYEHEDRGWTLRESAGGWRLYTSADCAPWLERFVLRGSHGRLTAAALEVLAIVAYRGPLSRGAVTEIRGVDSDGVVKTLMQRGYVEESGRAPGPGAPALLRVTPALLERVGLRSLDDLPPLREFMPDTEAVEEMEAHLSPGAG
jgi:segregation and condensation protein B